MTTPPTSGTEHEAALRIQDLISRIMAEVGIRTETAEETDVAIRIRAEEGTKKTVQGFLENSQ